MDPGAAEDDLAWTNRTPEIKPSGRRGFALVYDAARERVLLFGGWASDWRLPNYGDLLDETWEWDGLHWTQLAAEASPPGRSDHALAYDSARERVVLFGGRWDSSGRDDTWEWDGTGWTGHYPNPRPFPSSGYGLAYDEAHRQVVFLGSGGTWTFGVPETTCDDLDDNGNGLVDEGCDDDGDGYCDAATVVAGSPSVCPGGITDCDDGDSTSHPGAWDLPGDTVDQDCDGVIVGDSRDPWSNHGQFVACVARACGRLVNEGAVSREECTQLVRDAASGPIGR